MIEIDTTTLSILLGTVFPLLVGVVTKQVTHSGVKAVLLAGLAAATGALTSASDSMGILSDQAVLNAVLTWVTSVATYYGFLKPTKISETVNVKTKNIGL